MAYKNIEDRRKHDKEYYKDNKERISERGRKYYQKNKDRVKLKSKKYYSQNKDLILSQAKTYYEVNKAKIKDRNFVYRQKTDFKIKRMLWWHKRRALKKSTTDNTVNLKSVQELLESQGCKCKMCNRDLSKSDKHLDHIKPLCVGGEHSIKNLQWLCAKCNLTKPKKSWI